MNATNLTGEALVEAHKSATRKLRLVSVLLPVVFISVIFAYLASIADQVRKIDSFQHSGIRSLEFT